MHRNTWLLLAYALVGLLVVFNGFTRGFIDEPNMLLDIYLISQGEVPYTDFFEHHPLTHTFLLAPLASIIGNGVMLILTLHLLAIASVFLLAWLIFCIARREKFNHPHLASLFFLVGYTALPMSFLRDEFFAMLFLILFFAVSHPFAKGAMLAILGGISPVIAIPAAVLFIAFLIQQRNDRRMQGLFVCGTLLGGLIWLGLHRMIVWETWFAKVIVLNSALAADYHRLPFIEVLFFSLIFTIPLVAVAAWYAWRRARQGNKTAVLAVVFGATFIAQIIVLNVINGPWLRLKLPGTLVLLGLSTIFIADARRKFGIVLVALQLILTLFVFTPAFDFPRSEFFAVEAEMDRCVSDTAEIRPLLDDHSGKTYAVLLRPLKEYYWGGYYSPPFGPDASAGILRDDEVDLCMNAVSYSDLRCDDAQVIRLRQRCDSLREQSSVWLQFRKMLKESVNFL